MLTPSSQVPDHVPDEWIRGSSEPSVPEYVPDEWRDRYADPQPRDPWAQRLAEIERSTRRDMRLLMVAAAMCVGALVLSLGWVGLVFATDVGRAGVGLAVIVGVFGLCLWQVHGVRRRQGHRPRTLLNPRR